MVQSIDRAVDIIQILDSCDKKDYWSISEITDRTSLPISTVQTLHIRSDLDGNRLETIRKSRL